MEVSLRKTSQFFSDLTAIINYIAPDSPDAAFRFLDAVEETLEMLRRTPELGSRFPSKDARLQNLRRISIRGFRDYLLFYDLCDNEAVMLRVVHAARDLNQLI